MTEKILLVDNPFNFEKDAKKFIQSLEMDSQLSAQEETNEIPVEPYDRLYQATHKSKKFGIIRALDEEAEKIAKAREEALAREEENKNAWKNKKTQKMWELNDHETKKQAYRIKNILKEKRETIAEFVKKKREIFLSNMNINNKKEETNRLEDFIKNEQESLKARQHFFSNDVQLVRKFMDEVKQAADLAQKKAEDEAKRKEILKKEYNSLTGQVETLETRIGRVETELKNLQKYETFINQVKDHYSNLIQEMKSAQLKKEQEERERRKRERAQQQYQDSGIYLTQIGRQEQDNQEDLEAVSKEFDDLIPFTEKQLLDILNDIEQKNLHDIQQKSELEGVFDQLQKQKQQEEENLKQLKKSDDEKIKDLLKQKAMESEKNDKLKQLKSFDTSKVKISEGEDLDMEQIDNKIREIFKSAFQEEKSSFSTNFSISEKKQNGQLDSKEMKNMMKAIEDSILKLSIQIKELEEIKDPEKREIYKSVKKDIKEKNKQQKAREEKEAKEQEIQKNVEAARYRKDKVQQNRRVGRPLMVKTMIPEKEEKKEEVKVDQGNDEEKYLKPEYEMGRDLANEKK